jgi:T-complex protein 1 subunit zeta
MLVGGAGQIKLTKDGSVLLSEMQIQHPTATMIARSANAQDDIVGDGTTSNVLFIGELLKQSERILYTGVHPRAIVDGLDIAKQETMKLLNEMEIKVDNIHNNRDMLMKVARSSLYTKLEKEMAEQLANIVTDACLCIRTDKGVIDLHMVEIMHMKHKMQAETKLIKGLVLDHGARNVNMKKYIEDTYVLTCNVSLE